MTGLEIIKAPGTTAGEIADIIFRPCPPEIPGECDRLSCRECWLSWLTNGEPSKEKGASDKQTVPAVELTDDLTRAEAALERAVQIIQSSIVGEEQRALLSDMSTFGRLLEKERNTPTTTDQEKIAYIIQGLITESIHFVATPMKENMVMAEFIDVVRWKLAARFLFERKFGGYYIKLAELFPL